MFTSCSFGKVGVEAYAAYALRAWLTQGLVISARTRRFAKWSAIFSFALGMAGQVAYHLMAQAGAARAPWPVTTIVSCLPVLVLAMGTTLAHMLRADTGTAADPPGNRAPGPAVPRSSPWSCEDRAGPAQDQSAPRAPLAAPGPSGPGRPRRTATPGQQHPACPGSARRTSALAAGVTVLIADMTVTAYCTLEGVHALIQEAAGAQLRLAAVRPAVQRVLDRTGTSRLLRLYPTLEAARDAVGL